MQESNSPRIGSQDALIPSGGASLLSSPGYPPLLLRVSFFHIRRFTHLMMLHLPFPINGTSVYRSQRLACRILRELAREPLLIYELLRAGVAEYFSRLLPKLRESSIDNLLEVNLPQILRPFLTARKTAQGTVAWVYYKSASISALGPLQGNGTLHGRFSNILRISFSPIIITRRKQCFPPTMA